MTLYFPDINGGTAPGQFQHGINLAGALIVTAKATEGTYYTDPDYVTFKTGAATAGTYFQAYHFLIQGSVHPVSAQASYCYSVVGSAVPLMLDVEATTGSNPTLADVTGFIDAYRALGGICYWLYLPQSYWASLGSPSLSAMISRGMLLWNANYTTYTDAGTGAGWQPYGGMTPTCWQYSDSITFGGISGVDFSAFRGNYAGDQSTAGVAAALAQFKLLATTGTSAGTPPPNPLGSPGQAGTGPGGGGGGGTMGPGGAGGPGQILLQYTADNGGAAANIVRFLLDVPASEMPDNAVILRWYSTGTIGNIDVSYITIGGLVMTAWANGVQLFTTGPLYFAANGKPLLISAEIQQAPDGSGSIWWALWAIGLDGVKMGASGGYYGTYSVGQVTSVVVNPQGVINDTSVGQIAVQYAYTDVMGMVPALQAYAGELAASRFLRLCGEEGVSAELQGSATDTETMGVQVAGQQLVALLEQCAAVDMGVMYETKGAVGLGYRTRVDLCNQQAAAVLSYEGGELAVPLAPTDDDQHTVNDVTVTRNGGSSAHVTLDTGGLSTQQPPDGVGVYPKTYTVYSELDGGRLTDTAAWLLWLGTQEELRYPIVNIDLARSEVAQSFTQIQAVGPGDLIQITGTPDFLPPGIINQLALGFTETLNTFTYTIGWNCVPGLPYFTGIFEDQIYSRADTDGSGLTVAIDTVQTAISVSALVPGSPLWVQTALLPLEFPFDVLVGGEQMTVTAITGAASPQTFTVIRSVNSVIRAHQAYETVSLAYPAIFGM